MPKPTYFSLSPNLKVVANDNTLTIRYTYQLWWLLITFMMLLGVIIFGALFTLILTLYLSPYDTQTFVTILITLLTLATIYLLGVYQIYFHRKMIHISLTQKKLRLQKGIPKGFQSDFSFQDIAHWQLKGRIRRIKNRKVYGTTLFIELKQGKGLYFLFDFNHSGWQSSEKQRHHSYQKGKEVCKKLHELTGIPWRWVDYS